MPEIKNKYRPTIGNVSALIITCFAIYFIFNPGIEGWGLLAGISLIFLCLIIVLIDFLLQKFIKNYWAISIVEAVLLTAILVLF